MTAPKLIRLLLAVVALVSLAHGLGERATTVRDAYLYVAPDATSNKLADISRGLELVIIESSRDWLKVEALLGEEKTVTGWMLDKGLVRASTPDGDKIVFGEAADSEDQASRRGGRRHADDDAQHLYMRVYEQFPNSPLAGEALYRAADIKWQLERAQVASRPSAHEKEAFLRVGMDEEMMRLVMKKFSGSKWADLAAYHLIENKLCGDWQGDPKCPEKEAEYYEKYANDRAQSPRAAEALYNAASRQAALIELYKSDQQPKKSSDARPRAIAIAQRVLSQYPQSDYAPRAQSLLFKLKQGVPTYGNGTE